jgi:hypothetical protein
MSAADNVLVVLEEIDDELEGIDDLADRLREPVEEAAIRTRVQAIRRRLLITSALLGAEEDQESAVSQFSSSETSVDGSTEENAMTDYRLHAEPEPITLIRIFGPENWQFFAFVFAVLLTFGCSLVDEIPDDTASWRVLTLSLKVVVFVGFGYLTLFSSRGRNQLARILPVIKTERS